MSRITVSLPDDLAEALGREARRTGASVSALVRKAVARMLDADRESNVPFAGLGASGRRDVAERAEELLEEEWGGDARDR